MSRGVQLIATERQRQINQEGWSKGHDKQHDQEELVLAAACYAIPSMVRKAGDMIKILWPWDMKWWKPSPENRIKELTKAGALIAAEIDRLLDKE